MIRFHFFDLPDFHDVRQQNALQFIGVGRLRLGARVLSMLEQLPDVRDLLTATVKLADGKKLTEMDLPLKDRLALRELLKKVRQLLDGRPD